MADYTTEEITTAVEKVVRSSVRRLYGLLGNRDIQTSFNDLQDAVAGLLTLNPNAPFYITWLGSRRLDDLLETQESTLTSLIEAIENTNRNTTAVDNLAPLQNARVALQALESAAASRTRTFDSVEDVPAYRRYDSNLQRFLDDSSANVRKNGAVVPTPEEARAAIPGLVTDLAAQQEETLGRTTYLRSAIDDYDSLQLPSLMASGVISRSREVLSERIEELEALSPRDRLAKVRDATLDILAGRAAVKGMGSLKSTTIFALLEGTGQVFADATHPATVATAIADLPGPYPIIPLANELYFRMDGSFLFTAVVPSSYLAVASGNIPESGTPPTYYDIVAATNDKFIIGVDGHADLTVTLTPGVARMAQQIVDDITGTAGYGALPIVAEVAYVLSRFRGLVDIEDSGLPGAKFILPSPGVWEDLQVRVGDYVKVKDSSSAYDGNEYIVTIVSGDTLTTIGAWTVTPETLKEIEVGVGKVVRLRIKDGEEIDSLNERVAITIVNDDANTAVPTLGFIRGGVYRCRSTSAQQVAQILNTSYSTQQLGVARLRADSVLAGIIHDGLGRSDPDDGSKVVAHKYREYGSTVGGAVSPAEVEFTVAGAAAALRRRPTLRLPYASMATTSACVNCCTSVD